MGATVLNFLIFWPLAAAGIIVLLRADRPGTIRNFALGATLLEFFVSLYLLFDFTTGGGFQFTTRWVWSEALGVAYQVGIDGISLFLVLLTTFLTAIAVWASFSAIKERVKGYFIAFMVLEAGMIGTFCATDLFLFYVFWELMLLPMYFLIGIWGGPNRVYATIKFVLYTITGSLLMLVAIIVTANLVQGTTGSWTFDLLTWLQADIPAGSQLWLFLAFAFAFAIKVPLFPFHTWLPDAHVQAPTAGSIILAGVLLKMGTYGFLRFAIPLFPAAFLTVLPYLVVLSVIGIIYGALIAMVQKDIKSLVAYSSVSHLGFAMLGICAVNTIGFSGSLLQQINHGISTGALFLLVGILYERRHTRLIADYGGLFKIVPVYTVFFMIIMLSSIGLPGTNGFVGEFLVLLGAFRSQTTAAVFGTVGIVLAAGYMLWMFQRVFFGKLTKPENEKIPDMTLRERAMMVPLVAVVFFIGLYPQPILERIEPALERVLARVHQVQLVNQSTEVMEGPVGAAFDELDKRATEIESFTTKEIVRWPTTCGGVAVHSPNSSEDQPTASGGVPNITGIKQLPCDRMANHPPMTSEDQLDPRLRGDDMFFYGQTQHNLSSDPVVDIDSAESKQIIAEQQNAAKGARR